MIAGCHLSGADRIFRIGGAQAIAAMAFGTESVPKVDKIVGPGNAFVNEAKRQVFGPVGIDQLAGPSEIYVLADETGDAEMIATDLLAQAEHDVRTRVGLITTDRRLAEALERAASSVRIELASGVYAGTLGPAYETPAEIRALRALGADLVGMSTIAEASASRAAGMRVTALSMVANHAAGIGGPLAHEDVLAVARVAAERFARLLSAAVPALCAELQAADRSFFYREVVVGFRRGEAA